jgi:glycosyltransferase involved in cell wall biosynthesis
LSTPRITVGLPVYKGAELIAKCLNCLQRQTFSNFEAIISVDGGDTETAAACRPFLADPRFRMVVHPKRLDWVGNFNWLLQQDLREFFCYRQHDDTTAPEFFEVLLQAADKEPNAAAVYCDCQWMGGHNHIEIAHSIEGEPLDRMLQYIERRPPTALRGLIRRGAIEQAGLLRSDEFRAPLQEFGWLASLVRWGNFRRVAKPLYYKLDHPRSFTNDWNRCPQDHKRAVMTTMFTGLLESAMPLCRTPAERLFVQQFTLEQIVLAFLLWPGNFQRLTFEQIVVEFLHRPSNECNSSGNFIAQCLERLKYEGNTHLLGVEELPPILQELQRRPDQKLLYRSLMRRVIYRIRQRYRMARLIYPRFRMRRTIYQVRHLLEMLTSKIYRLSLPTRLH